MDKDTFRGRFEKLAAQRNDGIITQDEWETERLELTLDYLYTAEKFIAW